MNPYAYFGALALAIGLFVGGTKVGWEVRGDHEAAKALEVKEKADKLLKAEQLRADILSKDLEVEKRNIKTVMVETIKEIPKVTTVYVERTGDAPKPIPPAVITNGTVGLYNYTLTAGVPQAAGKFAYTPSRADLTRANVDIPDILAVHAENAAKWAECRSQLNKLIDFHEGKPSNE